MKSLTKCGLLWFSIALILVGLRSQAVAAGKQLTGPYAPATEPALSPAEAQGKFILPAGFEARLFAAEPDVINPVAMTWDERGRLWVLELYEYPLGAPPGAKPRDRIKILEDTDNDGRADKVTIFADGLNLATGLLLGNGGVYVGQAPDLLFLQDTNHDDIADTRTTLLTGFGLDDRHELLNGFAWGPDGWMYLTHGVFTHSKVKIPEASAPGVEVTAAVARFQPSTRKFEVFADGTSNPWGVDFDARGNAFVSACVIDHLFHMAPGGIYARQGGAPANPYAYEMLPSIVQHKHHMAAYCGICVYQGNQFPDEYRGAVLMGNIHQSAINMDRLKPNGSSFIATADKDFLTTSDGWFRPISEQVGPDGALWVGDWYDKYPCYQNAQADPEGVDRTHGRIWRILWTGKNAGAPIGSRPDKNMDLAKLSSSELVKLLEHPNIWQRRTAQRILSERHDESMKKVLSDLAGGSAKNGYRLAALWTLHSSGLLEDAVLDKAAKDKDPGLRMWAARLTGERHQPTEQTLFRMQLLASDPDPAVRLAVATAARQFTSGSLTVDTPGTQWEGGLSQVLLQLISASHDAKDPLLPYMIWLAGEPSFSRNPRPALEWLASNGKSLTPLDGILARKGMRRICDTQDKKKLDEAVAFLERVVGDNIELALPAIDGLLEGQKGKPFKPESDTAALFETLGKSDNAQLKERGQRLGALWDDAGSIRSVLATVANQSAPADQRLHAIDIARELHTDASRGTLLSVIAGEKADSILIPAIRALGSVGGEAVAGDLLKDWNRFSAAARSAATETLTSRREWALDFLTAVESNVVSRSELSMTVIRSLADSKDQTVRERTSAVIGRVRPVNEDKQAIIAEKKKMILAGGPPDVKAGHALLQKTCLVCHKLYGEGAEVGPDLTGVGRSSLDALLANVIDPNQVVGKGYELVEIETRDGRSVSGRLVENTASQVKLLSSGPKEEVIARFDIASMRTSELSVMPEGLEQMPEADFRNLILYVLHPPQEQKK